MKRNILILSIITIWVFITSITYYSCRSSRVPLNLTADTIYTNIEGEGNLLEILFRKGTEHNHPLMAIWIEDTNGTYIQTLYVAESIAKGVYGYSDNSTGKWMPGPIRRPAALPVWAHSRGVKEADGLYIPTQKTPIPDAYTGPTPPGNFILFARTDRDLPERFFVFFEINQTWDWNEYWTNNKFPDDDEYKTSCQPALVYRVLLEKDQRNSSSEFELIGHSHFNGKDGEIYPDISTITTAKNITESLSVRIIYQDEK